MSTNQYKVWTGDGNIIDGSIVDTYDEALADICSRYDWDDPVVIESGAGEAWFLYENQEDADADTDGAYAPSITEILPCHCPVVEGCQCETE